MPIMEQSSTHKPTASTHVLHQYEDLPAVITPASLMLLIMDASHSHAGPFIYTLTHGSPL